MTEDKRRIHIRGIGTAAQTPDLVILSLTLAAQHNEYAAAMKIGSQQVEMLREAIVEAGFKADELKTTNFNVRAVYENEETKDGNSKRYCRHDLKLTFDFDNDKLNRALDTIAANLAQPKISIAFAVKDTAALNDAILKSAAADARRKAEILCAASGVKLGRLIDINYSWDDSRAQETIVYGECASVDKNSFDLQPEDFNVSDSVDFLWEIE